MELQIDDVCCYVEVELFGSDRNKYVIWWKEKLASFTDPPNRIFVENVFPFVIERTPSIYEMLRKVVRSGQHKVEFKSIDDYLRFKED